MSEKKKELIDWRTKHPTMEHQLEFFLLKFSKDSDISRTDVHEHFNGFKKHGKPGAVELDEIEVLRFLEVQNKTKTARELRALIAEMDQDANGKLSFLEYACATFNKSFDLLLTITADIEEIAAAEKFFLEAAEKEAKMLAEAQEAEDASNKKRLDELKAAESKAAAEGNLQAAADAKAATEAETKRQAEALKKKTC